MNIKEILSLLSPQCRLLYEHMKEHGGVSQMEAFELYGITRVASRIHDMRVAGIGIVKSMRTGTNRYGRRVSYAVYRLAGAA